MALKLRQGLNADRAAITPEIGELIYATDTKTLFVGDGTTAGGNAISGGGSGTVTSVGGTGTVSGVSLSGTVTSSGNLTLGGTLSVTPSNFASQTANTVLSAPNGTNGTPTFRSLVAADIPTLNQNTTGTAANVTGTVAVANGGTGTATPALVAGTNVTITGTWPNQTIAASGGGGGSGTVTSVDATVPTFLSVTGGPITTSGTLAISYSGTALPIANGGTGATTQQAAINALAGSVQNSRFLAGNGTNVTMRAIAVDDVPALNQDTTGTAANITGATNSTLTTLSSLSLPGSQVSGNISGNSANVTGTVAVANGGTGTATPSLVAGTNVTVTGSWPNQTIAASGGGGSSDYTGFKNRLINGQMQIAQRATSGTSGNAVPTTTPTYPSVDRWYAYATGATVTVAQVAGSNANKNNLQVTGAASVTAVGIGQRIEQLNSYDLAGSTATLSVNISNSLLTTVTWTASYATSADTWSAKTQIATGTFTVTSTLTNYNAQISIPAAATTGIEILFTVGAQTSGTWVIGNVQLEKSSTATSFDYRSIVQELALCQRYLPAITSTGANEIFGSGMVNTAAQCRYLIPFQVTPRISPTGVTIPDISKFNVDWPQNAGGSLAGSSISFLYGGFSGAGVSAAVGSAPPGFASFLRSNASGAKMFFTGCEL